MYSNIPLLVESSGGGAITLKREREDLYRLLGPPLTGMGMYGFSLTTFTFEKKVGSRTTRSLDFSRNFPQMKKIFEEPRRT